MNLAGLEGVEKENGRTEKKRERERERACVHRCNLSASEVPEYSRYNIVYIYVCTYIYTYTYTDIFIYL